jgi:hypothetical protein
VRGIGRLVAGAALVGTLVLGPLVDGNPAWAAG